jgi:hypothetical protein
MKRAILVLTTLIVVSGCALGPSRQPRVNGKSDVTTTASLKAIYAQHSDYEICLLQTAIIRIQVGDKAEQEAKTGAKNAKATPLGAKINGMTYDEIISFSQKYPDKVTGLCRK